MRLRRARAEDGRDPRGSGLRATARRLPRAIACAPAVIVVLAFSGVYVLVPAAVALPA